MNKQNGYGRAFGQGTEDRTGFGGGYGDGQGSEPADIYSGDGKPHGYGTGAAYGWGYCTGYGDGTGFGHGWGDRHGCGDGGGFSFPRGCADCTGGV